MKLFRSILLGLLVLVCSVSPADDVYGNAGTTAYSFLKIDVGARSAALGGTSLLNAGGLAVFSNPALLSSSGGSVTAGHNNWMGNTTRDYIAWVFTSRRFSFSLAGDFIYTGNIEMRDEASGEPLCTFSSWDTSLLLGSSVRAGIFDIGVSIKLIREKLWLQTSSGIAFSTGVVVSPSDRLRFAALLANMGQGVTMVEREYNLPLTWQVGVGWSFEVPYGFIEVTGEVTKANDSNIRFAAGVEYLPLDWISLRGGFRFADDCSNLTAGTGFHVSRWTLDYAFVPFDYALGAAHRFTLSLGI